MKQGVRIGLVVAVLGWLAIVMSGCAVTKAPESPTDVQQAQPAGGDAYRQAAEALAQAAQPIVRQAAGNGASVAAEVERWGLAEDGAYDGALYSPEEPLASMIKLVKTEEDCNDEQIECFDKCWKTKPPLTSIKKGSGKHHEYCTTKCLHEFMDCMKKAGLSKEFTAMDAALTWIKSHGKEILGTLVVVGSVTYVVVSGGAGVLILAVL